MGIQQHDGVVVDVAGLGRASPSFCERERCSRGGGRRSRLRCSALPPPLYIGPLGGGAPAKTHLVGGRRPGACRPPQGKWGAPPP